MGEVLIVIALLLGIMDFIIFKIAGRNREKRIIGGVICIFLAPPTHVVTYMFIGSFDPHGIGAIIISILVTFFVGVNGAVVLLIGLLTKPNEND